MPVRCRPLPSPQAHPLVVAALACLFLPATLRAAAGFSEKLAAQGRLSVPLEQARAIEARLGQMLIVNVDGFGYGGSLALEPGFIPMIEKLQVGGVIPHYGSTDYQRIRRTNRALAAMTEQPLLICCDIVKLASPLARPGSSPKIARFGDGYVGGFIGRFRGLPDEDFRRLAMLNAFTFASLGINLALGPTVDDSTGDARTVERARVVVAELGRFAVLPVLKHFPFLPRDANLHRESPDTKVALRDVETRAAVFARLSSEAPILMTTHLMDSLVDPDLVTFSPGWVRILRRESRFRGLLMTDGLLMLENYRGASAALLGHPGGAGGGAAGGPATNGPAAWAARAVLAGHDLLIVEGTAAVTYKVFEGLLAEACGSSPAARRLRDRIDEATTSIARFKKQNTTLLRRRIDISDTVIAKIIALAPAEDARPAGFRVDPAGFAAVEQDLRRASLR